MKTHFGTPCLRLLRPLFQLAFTATSVLVFFAVRATQAADDTWKLDPTSGDWNTAANWVDNTVPNGPFDTAFFGTSNLTNISVSTSTTVYSIVFNVGASAYNITCSPGQVFSFANQGISNDSGVVQNFAATVDGAGNSGFFNVDFESNLGNSTVFTNYGSVVSGGNGGLIQFGALADAGSATLINQGGVVSGANGGETDFFNSATADSATITNQAGLITGALGGTTVFWFNTRAGNSLITCEGATATGAAGGTTLFRDNSSAGNGTLIANGGSNGGSGGAIQFEGKATAGTTRVEVFGNGELDLSALTTAVLTIGSLEGDGQVFLGSHKLSVGASNSSTTFSGVIQDSGSLTKLGTGTLTLSGANTYTGGTTIIAGALKVDNRAGSGTGAGTVAVNAGTLSGKGIISGAVTIGTGSGAGAFLAPGQGVTKPTTLTIQSALTFKADGTYTYRLNTRKAKADKVIANGATIEGGAQFSFKQVANRNLAAGTVFTAISNTAATPVAGTFANLPDDSTFTAGRNTYQADYQGGDGNDLTLTVVP